MFEKITDKMKKRMNGLEEMDRKDRSDGTERMKRLRQIPADTGKFLALTAANTPAGEMLEVGTSAGYSTMWLSLAAACRNSKIITHELLEEKIRLAKETFQLAGINDYVELKEGDALDYLKEYQDIAFCFIDCEKELYDECWEIISRQMVHGGIIVADNAISHKESLEPFIQKVLADSNFDSLVLPIGKGELYCRRK